MLNSDVSYRVCDFVYREEKDKFDTIKPQITSSRLESFYVNLFTLLCEFFHLFQKHINGCNFSYTGWVAQERERGDDLL